MPFKTPAQLKKFLNTAEYSCKENMCPYESNDLEEFSQHMAEHAMIKLEEKRRKFEVAKAKPNKELVNMLGKIINDI